MKKLNTNTDINRKRDPMGRAINDYFISGKAAKLRVFSQMNRDGQTILMVTHSTAAASHAGRVLFIRDGVVFHQLYRGDSSDEVFYKTIANTLTMLRTGRD